MRYLVPTLVSFVTGVAIGIKLGMLALDDERDIELMRQSRRSHPTYDLRAVPR